MDQEFYAALAETPQFDALIAPDAGIGRSAFALAGNNVVGDPGPKHFSGADDLMRGLQLSAPHNGRYPDLAASTFLPTLEDRDCCVLVFPSLKRDAINVIVLSDQ
jgi:hypothetical protein